MRTLYILTIGHMKTVHISKPKGEQLTWEQYEKTLYINNRSYEDCTYIVTKMRTINMGTVEPRSEDCT